MSHLLRLKAVPLAEVLGVPSLGTPGGSSVSQGLPAGRHVCLSARRARFPLQDRGLRAPGTSLLTTSALISADLLICRPGRAAGGTLPPFPAPAPGDTAACRGPCSGFPLSAALTRPRPGPAGSRPAGSSWKAVLYPRGPRYFLKRSVFWKIF